MFRPLLNVHPSETDADGTGGDDDDFMAIFP